jgi:hypothetical protein
MFYGLPTHIESTPMAMTAFKRTYFPRIEPLGMKEGQYPLFVVTLRTSSRECHKQTTTINQSFELTPKV